jgi:hypothetical protein
MFVLNFNVVFCRLGFRFLFVAIPFAFYDIGPLALVIATFVILVFSIHHDYNYFVLRLFGMCFGGDEK